MLAKDCQEVDVRMALDVWKKGRKDREEEEAGGCGLKSSGICAWSGSGRRLREVSGLQEMFGPGWKEKVRVLSLVSCWPRNVSVSVDLEGQHRGQLSPQQHETKG